MGRAWKARKGRSPARKERDEEGLLIGGVEGNSETEMAARVGAAEAEIADLKLRLKESHEREQRLIEVCKEVEEALDGVPKREQELRETIKRFAAFHRGVEQSRAWKLVQGVRRLFGREW